MLKVILFKIPHEKRYFEVEMPRHAELMGVQKLPGKIEHQLFALCEMTEPTETRRFRQVQTDQEITQADHEIEYVGSFHVWLGDIISKCEVSCHIFELID